MYAKNQALCITFEFLEIKRFVFKEKRRINFPFN